MAKNFLKALDEPTELEQTLDGRQLGARSSAERQQARGAQTQAMGELFDWLKTAKKTYDVHGQVARGAFSEAVDNPLFRWLREKGLRPEMIETATDLWAPGVGMVKGMAKGAGKTAKKLAADPSDWMLEGETLGQALTRKGELAPTMGVTRVDPVGMTSIRADMEQVKRVEKSFKKSGLKVPQWVPDRKRELKAVARKKGEELGVMRKASEDATRRLDMTIDPDSAMGQAMVRTKERGVAVGGHPLPRAKGASGGTMREGKFGKEEHSIWLGDPDSAPHEWTHALFANLDEPAKKRLIDAFTESGKAPHPSVAARVAADKQGGMLPPLAEQLRDFPDYATPLSPRTTNEGLAHTLRDLVTPGEEIVTEPLFLYATFDLMGNPDVLFRRFQERMAPEVKSGLEKLLRK